MEEKLTDFFKRMLDGFDPATSLLAQFDSLQLFVLVPKIEIEFGVQIYSMELTPQRLQSIESLAKFISSKL